MKRKFVEVVKMDENKGEHSKYSGCWRESMLLFICSMARCKGYSFWKALFFHILPRNECSSLLLKCLGEWGCSKTGRVDAFRKNFYLSFKGESYGQRLEKIGFIGRRQISVVFWAADWQYLFR